MPFRELGKILEDPVRVGSEIVRTVRMDQYAGRVIAIVGVATDMPASIHDQTFLSKLGAQAFREHEPGEPGTDDEKSTRSIKTSQSGLKSTLEIVERDSFHTIERGALVLLYVHVRVEEFPDDLAVPGNLESVASQRFRH